MSQLWEILVPTVKNAEKKKFYKTKYHKLWDDKVRKISGGLSILGKIKGQWLSSDKELFVEEMIPVRIVCDREEIDKIADMTREHYDQQAIMYYLISNECVIKNYEKDNNLK